MKQFTYKDFSEKLYFVVANHGISQEDINKLILNKKNILSAIAKMKVYSAIIAGE